MRNISSIVVVCRRPFVLHFQYPSTLDLYFIYVMLLLSFPFWQLNSCEWPSLEQGNVQGQQLSKGHWDPLCSLGFEGKLHSNKTVNVFLCRYIRYTGRGLCYGCWSIIRGNGYNRVCGYVPCLEMSSEQRSHHRGQLSRCSRKESMREALSVCWPFMCCLKSQISAVCSNQLTS